MLNQTVVEVREFLRCDRVLIYRFNSDWSGVIEVESVGDGWQSILAEMVEDTCFQTTRGEDYRQGLIQAIADIYTAGLSECHFELLSRFQVRANLAVPILQGESLWGLLVSKLLQIGRLEPAKAKAALATIERNAILQSQLIEDLLDVSRILRGKLELQVSAVNLATIIEAALETVRLAAEAKTIQIQIFW